jgi:hypothetical protein
VYNLIAEIYVLYEDLKLETEKLFNFAIDLQREGDVKKPYEVLYYIRRSTVSLNEYRRALNALNAEKEFRHKLASLDKKYVLQIEEANRYFQANQKQIRGLRNTFGGHINPAFARHATANFAPNEVGKIEWIFDSAHPWALNLNLAMNIIVAGLDGPAPWRETNG